LGSVIACFNLQPQPELLWQISITSIDWATDRYGQR
jgi:hypothetical protein